MGFSLLITSIIRLILTLIGTCVYVIYLIRYIPSLTSFLFAPIPLELFLLYLWRRSRVSKYIYALLLFNILLTTTGILLGVYTTLTPIYDFPQLTYSLMLLLYAAVFYAIYLILREIPQPGELFGPDFMVLVQEKLNRVHRLLEKQGSRIFLTWLIFMCLFLSWRYGIFSSGVITTNDHPYHYYQTWYMVEYLIPVFQNAIGWSPHFYAGFPIMYHYPPGSYLFISLLNLGSSGIVSIGLAYRILFVLALLATPLSVYFFTRELRLDKTDCAVIGLLCIVPTFRHIETLYWGMTASILATGISPLVFAFLYRYSKTKRISALLTASLIFGVILLVHPIVAIGVGLGVILYIVLEKRHRILTILHLSAIPLMLSAFWIIPSIYYYVGGYWGVQTLVPFAIVKTIMGFINYHMYLLFGIPVVLLPFIYIAYNQFYRDKNATTRFLLLYPILLYVLSFYGSAIPQLQELQLLHLMPYLGLYIVIIAGLGISYALKQKSYKEFALFALIIAVISPAIGTLPFGIPLLMDSTVMNEESILSVGLPKEVTNVFDWVGANSDGRILLEEIDTLSGKTPWGMGFNLALAPVYANEARFIGGPLPYYNPSFTGNRTMTGEGVFFGMALKGIDNQLLIQRLDEFNVQHLVVWSNISKDFLDKAGDFELVKEIAHFSIYRYLDAPKSFIVATDGDVSANVTNFGTKTITLTVQANETSKVTVSSSYFPNWHAYANGKEIPVQVDDIFSQVVVPPGETPYDVLLVFEESPIEKYSKWLSAFSWIAVVSLICLYRLKGR